MKAPNPSSIDDKAKLGSAPPFDYRADPMSDGEKQFYENLPFHGMQNPPNKPVSIIAPFNQGSHVPNFTSSTNSIAAPNQRSFYNPLQFPDSNQNKAVKRNQSFNGFQNNQLNQLPLLKFNPLFNFPSGNLSNLQSSSMSNFQFKPAPLQLNQSQRQMNQLPSIFSHLPPSFRQMSGANTVAGISSSKMGTNVQNPQKSSSSSTRPLLSASSSVSSLNQRIIGRNESFLDIRRTASGINPCQSLSQSTDSSLQHMPKTKKLATIAENRFGSLDLKKHKCYSPTFYSMRCKKHTKKRPIIVRLPKKCFSELAIVSSDSMSKEKEKSFENLTDSIQILEESTVSDIPKPAPRCKKHHKIYANIQNSLNLSKDNNSSTDSAEITEPKIKITKVQMHVSNEQNDIDKKLKDNKSDNENKENIENNKPKLVHMSPKITSQKITLSPHALKNSPVLKVSPNFIKPKNESPKGALSRQIQAKIKASPAQSSENVNKSSVDDVKTVETIPDVPQMPVLCPQSIRSPNITNMNAQNAFYTLSTPHFKQLATVAPPQYSATIPNQKHAAKLLPKSLFQEPLPKSKSFSSKSKQKKHHFQIPLQKCHSFKFQTAESYFQPIKNIHEENLMRNGYVSDYPESSQHQRHGREKHHKREKHKQKSKGPLVLRRPNNYHENVHYPDSIQTSVQLQYPQPLLGSSLHDCTNAVSPHNGVVYADLDISGNSRKSQVSASSSSSSKSKAQKAQTTEYATLNFNEVRQEIDV